MKRFAPAFATLIACSSSVPGGAPVPSPIDEPALAESTDEGGFDVVAELDVAPGNIAVGTDGTPYVTLHQFFAPEFPVAAVTSSGAQRILDRVDLISPLGIAADAAGTIWALDNGLATGGPPRLVAQGSNGVIRGYDLSSATVDGSFVNDLVIDLANRSAYIADPANGPDAALIILDLASGKARRLLQGHDSVVPDATLDLVIDETPVTMKRDGDYVRPKIGVNPIAADATREWIYYGAMHGRHMYRITSEALRDRALGPKQLQGKVERYAEKPICDGIAIDKDGNLYLGDLANNAIGVITPDRQYRELIRDPRLSWVDAFAIGPDNMVYAVANQLQRSPVLNKGENGAKPPFLVVRFSPVRGR